MHEAITYVGIDAKAERFIQILLREMGLPPAVSQLGTSHSRPETVSALLQPPTSTCEPRPAVAVDAFPRDCLR